MGEQTFRFILTMEGASSVAGGFRQLSQALNQHSSAMRSAGGGGGGGGYPGGAIRGPFSRLAAAQANLQRASTATEIADATYNLSRAQAAVARAQTGARRIPGAGGGGIAGLAMGALRALAPEVAIAAVLAAGALHSLTSAVTEAAKSLGDLASIASVTGGTGAQASLMRLLGIDAGAAAALRERRASDPLAAMAGARLGLPFPGPGFVGNQNYARELFQALDALRKVTDAEERLRLARMLGIEGMIELTNLSETVYQQAKQVAAIQGRVEEAGGGPARDLNQNLKNLRTILETMLQGALIIPTMALNNSLQVINQWLINLAAKFGINTDAIQQNTNALHGNTNAMKTGYLGTGDRFRGAIPKGMAGIAFQKALENASLSYGAWALPAG